MRENIRYIFRQAPETSETSSIIRGWGVTMDIKNMEYKALDDRPLNTQNEEKKKEEETNIEYDEEIEGFLFQTLQKRYPQHRDSMESLRRELLEQVADSASEIKVWVRIFFYVSNPHALLNLTFIHRIFKISNCRQHNIFSTQRIHFVVCSTCLRIFHHTQRH